MVPEFGVRRPVGPVRRRTFVIDVDLTLPEIIWSEIRTGFHADPRAEVLAARIAAEHEVETAPPPGGEGQDGRRCAEMCNARQMRVGILGGTGPAGRALGTRLAANGVEVVLGSCSAERGVETAAEVLAGWPERSLMLSGGANDLAGACDIVVLARRGTRPSRLSSSSPRCSRRQGRDLDGQRARTGRQGVSGARAGHAVRWRRRCRRRFAARRSPPPSNTCPPRELGDLDVELEADVLICADDACARMRPRASSVDAGASRGARRFARLGERRRGAHCGAA